MSGRNSLTEKRIAALRPPASGYALHRDVGPGAAQGLAVRITATSARHPEGARTYVFEKRLKGGGNIRMNIGDAAAWRLGDARAEALRLTTVVNRGIDPRDEAAAKRAQAQAAVTERDRQGLMLAAVWQLYIKDRKAHWGARHHRNHLLLAQPGGERKKKGGGEGLTTAGPLATLMPLKLSELTAEHIASWLKREAKKRPANARQAYQLLRSFIRWTSDVPAYRGTIAADTITARAVRDVVPKARVKEGDCLQREQLAAWFKQVRAWPNPIISAYLQALLLTGARRNELAALRWQDVDFKWGGMTIRDKTESRGGQDGERTIPLTPFVASLLAPLPRKNEWVFSSATAKDGRIVEPRIAHTKALDAAGLPHVSLHGLRRSFGTLAEWVELPTGVVAQIQGHKPSALAEKHYRRRPLDLLRQWHTKLEAWVLEEAGVPLATQPAAKRLGVVTARGTVRGAA